MAKLQSSCLKAIVCAALAIVLLFPVMTTAVPVAAQNTSNVPLGPKLAVAVEYELVSEETDDQGSQRIFYSASGTVEVFQKDSPSAQDLPSFELKGLGSGTFAIEQGPDDTCEGASVSGSYQALLWGELNKVEEWKEGGIPEAGIMGGIQAFPMPSGLGDVRSIDVQQNFLKLLEGGKEYEQEVTYICRDGPAYPPREENLVGQPAPFGMVGPKDFRFSPNGAINLEETIAEYPTGYIKVKLSISPPDLNEVIVVKADNDVLNPTDANPKTVVTVTAMTVGGVKLKQMPIKIKVCTEIGSKTTDGHIHDSRSDKCDRGNRPHATLKYQGVSYHGTFDGRTNDAGQIVFDYEPAFCYRVFRDASTGATTGTSPTQKLYIAGKDDIIATKVSDERIKGETFITTKVQGLQQMAQSENCAGNTDYYFVQQGKHGCIFYSTLETNNAMARLSKAFVDKQIECKNNPGGKCYLIDKSGNNVTFTIVGDVKKVRITAMSLPWGGLHDIGGDFKNPHITHSGGKAVDIGLTGLGAEEKDRRLMLWHLISLDPNFSNFEVGEGRVFDLVANHFHANFRS